MIISQLKKRKYWRNYTRADWLATVFISEDTDTHQKSVKYVIKGI